MAKDKRFIISLKPSVHADFKMLSAKHRKTMNFIAQQALREFILKHKEEAKNER